MVNIFLPYLSERGGNIAHETKYPAKNSDPNSPISKLAEQCMSRLDIQLFRENLELQSISHLSGVF